MSATLQEVDQGMLKISNLETRLVTAENKIKDNALVVEITVGALDKKINNLTLPAQPSTNTPMPQIDVSNPPDSLPKADKTGATSSTAALIKQGQYCGANNRSMAFNGGQYLIEPGKVRISCSWYGFNRPIIFTQSAIPYNIMLAVEGNLSDISVEDMIFSQWKDTNPTVGAYPNGCNILHINNNNQFKIKGCEFTAYGMVSILTQPTDGYGKDMSILDNVVNWDRKGTVYYDSTPIWGDCLSGRVIGNRIYSVKPAGVDVWKGETGIEIHSPNCIVKDNEVYDHINGIIHCGWPTQYAAYDDSYRGYVNIQDNRAIRCSRGISCWGSHLRAGVVTRNMNIQGNYINLHLEKQGTSYYYPTMGIGFEDGRGNNQGDDSFFRNISIRNNQIETTYATGLNPASIMNYGPTPRNQRAAINMATNNSCENIDISENLISYPYTAIQLMAIRDRVQNTHKNIRAINNRFFDTAIWQTYGSGGFDAVYNLENINGFYAAGNQIIGKPIEVRQDGVNVGGVTIV